MIPHPTTKPFLHLLLAVALAAAATAPSAAGRDSDIGWGPTISTDANIYVSTGGSDANNGSIGSPVQSLSRARDLANTAKASSSNGVTVWLRGGWFTQSTTFTFNSTDGGSTGKPIIWRAYPNESVVIDGARNIDPTKWSSYSGPTSRLNPAVTAANIQQCNLSDLNLQVSGLLPAKIDDGDNSFIQNTNLPGLYWNGPRQTLAKYPKSGFMEVATVNTPGTATVSPVITYKTDPSQLYVSTNSIGHESAWVGAIPHGAWLKGYWRVAWQNTTLKILSIDTGAKTITLSPFSAIGNKYGDGHEPYQIINLLEEISQPGDWCVDSQDGKIYFYAPGTISPYNLRISDNVNPIFAVNGASYLQFIGLEVINNRGGAFALTNATSVQFNGCIIHDVDEDAVVISGGSNCGVASSNLYNLGAAGVSLGAAGDASNKCGHYVTNCHIYNFGVLNNIYAGAVNAGYKDIANYGSIVSKNLIHDSPHLGVAFGGSNSLFEANDVFRTCKLTDDVGTFYSYISPNTYGENTFQYNFSHNAPTSDGIYYDHYGSGDKVYCNVAYQMHRGFIYHNPWANVNCTNNISYDNDDGWSYIYPTAPGANIANNAAVSDTTPYQYDPNYPGTVSASNKSYTTSVNFADPANLLFSLQSNSPIFTDIPGFVNFPAGSRLEPRAGATGNGTPVDISTVVNTNYQHWTITLQTDGYFSLVPENAPATCLDVRSRGTADGTAIQIFANGNAINQHWSFLQADGTAATALQDGAVYQLAPKHAPGSRLDLTGNGAADGTAAVLWTANGTTSQRWVTRKQSNGSYDLIPQNAAGPGVYADSYRTAIPSRASTNYSVNPPPSGAKF